MAAKMTMHLGKGKDNPNQVSPIQRWQGWGRQLIRWSLRTDRLPARRLAKQDWLWLVSIFLVSRLLIMAIGVLGTALFPQYAPHGPLVVHPLGSTGPNSIFRLYEHFDSGWYIGISHGYPIPSNGHNWLAVWAFFPLFPMILHLLALLLSALHLSINTDILAGVITSYIFCFGGLVFLYKLVAAELSTVAAKRTVLFQAIFPASLFLSVVYPESVFLFTCVAAFYSARRGAWLWAGFFTAAALLARPQGLFLLAPLALEFIGQLRNQWLYGERNFAQLLPALWLGLPLVTLGGYALYSHQETHYWLAFSTSASVAWGHRLTPPFYPLIHFVLAPQVSGFTAYDFQPTNFLFAVLFLALIIVAWQRLPPAYGFWLLIAVLFPLSTNGHYFYSFARYVVTAFPAFAALAAWSLGQRSPLVAHTDEINAHSLTPRHQALRGALIIIPSLCGLAVYVVLFVNGYPAAI